MARLPRLVLVGHPHHVIIRGNNREPIFIANEDYRFYLDKLKLACEKHHCEVHAYVLMTNHVHLLITPHKKESLAKAMQMVGRYYVQYFNHCYRRTGTLWEGRYKSTVVDSDDYALICYRYIELNPVRARMVEDPIDYPWSSYRFNALGEVNDLVTPHSLYTALAETNTLRLKIYQSLFEQHISASKMNKIRDATNKSQLLGNELFQQKVQQQLTRRVGPKKKGGDRKSTQFKKSIESNP